MKYLHCYLLRTELINVQGESEGELPQFLIQVDEYNEKKKCEESKFLYLGDNIENLDIMIPKILQENAIIIKGEECIIDINNSSIVIEFDGNYFITVK